MSVRRWIITVVIGLSVFAVFGWAAIQTGRVIGRTEGRYQSNASDYARYAEKEMRRSCLSLDYINQVECMNRIINSTNEQRRSEQVLVAQTDMARWSLWMLVVTTAMAAVTALGVYYVWRTLLATQKMATDTRDIGQKQTRSFVNILPMQMSRYYEDFKLKFCIVNSGMTGAFDVKLRCTVVIYLNGEEKTSASGWESVGVMEGGRRIDEVGIFLPIKEMGVPPDFRDIEGYYAIVDAFVFYSDVFDVAHINHLQVGLYPPVGRGSGMMILKNEEHGDQKE